MTLESLTDDLRKIAEDAGIPESIALEYANDTGDADLSDLVEAYAGQYDSDESFARDMAENTGSISDAYARQWPLYCIDWERAAHELMMDYSEYSGYYFRNL